MNGITRLALKVGAVVVVGVVSVVPGLVEAQTTPASCSNKSLRGAYGLLSSGIRGLPPQVGGGTERFAATAVWTYDGQGGLLQSGGVLHGEVLGTQVDTGELVGAYEVNADCTGRSSLNVPGVPYPIEYSFVIVGNGRQVKAVVTSPKPNIVTASLDRL